MSFEPNDDALIKMQPADSQELNLGTRIDRNGKTTYHVLTSHRRSGVYLEKVYDQNHNLIRLQKRSRGDRSEAHFDTTSGALTRLFEAYTLPDGNLLSKEIIYSSSGDSTESVIVISPSGDVVRKVERHQVNLKTVFQGQTEYNASGTPATTVNHCMDPITGNLVSREQIQWIDHKHRALTENFVFDQAGALSKYSKTVYHAHCCPAIEETQVFDSETRKLLTREIATFTPQGTPISIDFLSYDEAGNVTEMRSGFCNQLRTEAHSQNDGWHHI